MSWQIGFWLLLLAFVVTVKWMWEWAQEARELEHVRARSAEQNYKILREQKRQLRAERDEWRGTLEDDDRLSVYLKRSGRVWLHAGHLRYLELTAATAETAMGQAATYRETLERIADGSWHPDRLAGDALDAERAEKRRAEWRSN